MFRIVCIHYPPPGMHAFMNKIKHAVGIAIIVLFICLRIYPNDITDKTIKYIYITIMFSHLRILSAPTRINKAIVYMLHSIVQNVKSLNTLKNLASIFSPAFFFAPPHSYSNDNHSHHTIQIAFIYIIINNHF